jgi:hypothetical protein
MSCGCENRRAATIGRMRELAMKAATMEGSIFVLYEKPDGSFGFAKEGEEFNGEFEEYVYPKSL